MLFLKSLLFLPANMLVAFLLVFAIRAFFFYPRREIKIKNRKIPFTPGIVPRYHMKIIAKINDLVYGYLHDCETQGEANRVDNWEEQVYQKCLTWLEKRLVIKIIPQKILTAVRMFLAGIGREFARQFLRTFIPYLLRHYNLIHYVDVFNEKFTLEFLQGYYDRYIYKYSLYMMLAIGFIIGIVNQIIYLIIGG
ncbi:MAG: hypothetical protein K9M99_11265 [Candidatus Cloacimonetes bacterium]|nr:hypothetical protein [Candidatus Cloacimonadota bacterium]